jgi:hypothetical protein
MVKTPGRGSMNVPERPSLWPWVADVLLRSCSAFLAISLTSVFLYSADMLNMWCGVGTESGKRVLVSLEEMCILEGYQLVRVKRGSYAADRKFINSSKFADAMMRTMMQDPE